MTLLRRARLAGALVALGIVNFLLLLGSKLSSGRLLGLFSCGPPIHRPGKTAHRARPVGRAARSLTERKAGLHAGLIALADHDRLCEPPLAFGRLALQKVPLSGFRANEFSGGGYFETLGDRLAGFASGNGFGHGFESWAG
jgi:hypothetical protein